MMSMPKTEPIGENKLTTYNSSTVGYHKQVSELTFEELRLQCQTLENEKLKLLTIRENLLILNQENEILSKRLLKIKTEFEFYKSHLHKTLFNIKVSTDKQKILSKKKLDEFIIKAHSSQEYFKASSKQYELEELIKTNKHLQKEWEEKVDLLKSTKKQHTELVNFIINKFQNKVCEFCDVVLRLKSANKYLF